ncbi:MAG: hypothetical protein ACHQ6U_04195 [Thermodesulfobacteriota bacterium]
MRPQAWSGAYKVWGIYNKEADVRVPHNPYGDGPERFEFKTADFSANPYIALSGIIASGADGLTKNLRLPDPVQRDPAKYTQAEMKKLGIELLPTSVSAALRKLDKDRVLKDAFGEEYYKIYSAVKLFEERAIKKLSLQDERKILLTWY